MRTKAILSTARSALVWIHLLAGVMLIGDLHAAGRPGLNVVVDAGSADELLTYANAHSSLVDGLVHTAEEETRLRNALLAADRTDRVTVSVWDGTHIPFVENTVNQIICDKVTDEMRRALAPYGCAVTSDGKVLWTKPYPKEMDEWPQYLYQANGNSVSQDMIVGPPRRIQWVGEPRTTRHHDHLTSLCAMVSAKGRVYYIFDEQTPASILFPPQWSLITRDAFNGVVLWKKKIPEWHPHLWPLKSMPATLPRRLVSIGDDLYVTLGIQAPVSHLKGSDGSVVKTYAGSERCEEMVVHGNTLLVLRLIGKGPLDDMDAKRGETGVDDRVTKFPLAHKLMGSAKSPLWVSAGRRLIRHIFAANGYLNGSWFHRAFWTYSTGWNGGCSGFGKTGNANHSGRIMINDGTSIYSFGRSEYGWGSAFTYSLYRAAANAGNKEGILSDRKPKTPKKKGGTNKSRTWSVDIPVLARSLVKAGDQLIVTGPKKLYDENEAIQRLEDPSTAAKVKAQAESWNKTADLLVISAADGKVEKKVSFDFAPVWDGVAVAEEALFLVATNGALYRLQ